ncbi:hypothetical protein FEM48_Zijuj03G0034100 [Ziziphus jujuba var. spinosa]|uniref:Xylanase inhibitor N-terminal domain-containing protein n=1 Tax=Ziziphus jujuba var. spinosa TaxID=714518 RepID=A0A978VMW6_ZIZJJ|nr:hypothetical protein FEM48_Zijuj03G0034100 [Ziziphus jujuba var. spinosa]
MKVVDKHGPCSQLHKDKTSKAPTPAEILQQDEYRVNSIQSHFSKNPIKTNATTIPAESGKTQSCSSPASPCQYGVRYGDKSYTVGDFSKERITINQFDVFDNFLFGCGHNNQGLFSSAVGLPGYGL